MSDGEDDMFFDPIPADTIVIDVEQVGVDVSRPSSLATSRLEYCHGAVTQQKKTKSNQYVNCGNVKKEPEKRESDHFNKVNIDSAKLTNLNSKEKSGGAGSKLPTTGTRNEDDTNLGDEQITEAAANVPVAKIDVTSLIAQHDSIFLSRGQATRDKKTKSSTSTSTNISTPVDSTQGNMVDQNSVLEVSTYCFAKDVEREKEIPMKQGSVITEHAEKSPTYINDQDIAGRSYTANIAAANETETTDQSHDIHVHSLLDVDQSGHTYTLPITGESVEEINSGIYDSVCNSSFSRGHSGGSVTQEFEVISHDQVSVSKSSSLCKHDSLDKAGQEKNQTKSEKFKDKDFDWKKRQAKYKSRTLKRSPKSENPFTQHSKFDDPHSGAMPEASEGEIEDHLNPFTMTHSSESDSDSSIQSDSTFDSSSEESMHEKPKFMESYTSKPLPPTPKNNQIKDLKYLISPPRVIDPIHEEVVLKRVNTRRLDKEVKLPDCPADLSQTEIKLRGVLQSLIDSEKNYVGSLDRLVKVYQKAIIEQFGIKKTDVKVAFENIENILQIHKMFQLELGDKLHNWYANESIGNIFHVFSQQMVINFYSEYVNNFESATEIIRDQENSKQNFKEFLRNKQMSSVDRLSLPGLMLKPIQRFPQFIMIIKDLLKYTTRDHHDREPLQEALTGIENVAHQLNERKRQSEQYYHGQQIVNKLAPRLHQEKNVFLIRQDDMEQLSQDPTGVNNVKQRRLLLMNDKLISVHVTHREQDGTSTDRYTYKWHRSLQDLELTTSAITPNMHTKVNADNKNTTTILSPKLEFRERCDEDPISIASELTDMMHDNIVIAQITQLVSTLKLSYPGLTEDNLLEIKTNLQKDIQGKDYQLQMLNSSTIIIQDILKKKKYIFSAPSSSVKQEWCIDFLLAKYALDVVNIPSWHKQDMDDLVGQSQPALLMRHMSVDMQRTFTKVKCSVRVYLPTKNEGSVEHLWVCSSTESQGQVSLVSLHTAKPSLIESFQATRCEILCVEMVPGFSLVQAATAFEEDTVWISTVEAEILVFKLSENLESHRRQCYMFQPGDPVICMTYDDDRMFCGTRVGSVVVFSRCDDGIWSLNTKIQLGGGSVTSMIMVNSNLWTACSSIYIINPDKCVVKDKMSHQLTTSKEHVNFLVKAGVGVWASFIGKPNFCLYHGESRRLIQDFNPCNAINEFISVYSGIKENGKNYEVTSLMASLGLLWVGTNVGIILTYPLPRLRDGVPRINQRPQVSLHGHNGPVKFIFPVHYGPLSGVPIRRRASSIMTRNKVDKSVIKKLSRVDEVEQPRESTGSDKYISLDAENMAGELDDRNIYETVKYGSQEKELIKDMKYMKDKNEDQSPAIVGKTEKAVLKDAGEQKQEAGGDDKLPGESSSLVQSDEHKYFILEPGTNEFVAVDEASKGMPSEQNNVQVLPSHPTSTSPTPMVQSDVVDNNSASNGVNLRSKTGRKFDPELSFKSELKNKLRNRASNDDLIDYDVTDDNVGMLYPTLTRSGRVDSSIFSDRHITLPTISQGQRNESLYTRPFMKTPISASKPDIAATRVKTKSSAVVGKDKTKKSSQQFKQAAIISELNSLPAKKPEPLRKMSIGSSFSAGSSVDTLRKQDTSTLLVLSGGDGYKDWKKRQSLQSYRPEEPCIIFWMYKF